MIDYNTVKQSILREKEEYKKKQRKLMSVHKEEKANECKEYFVIYSAMYQKVNSKKYKNKEIITIEDLKEIDSNLKLITKAIKNRHSAMVKEFSKAEKDNNMKKCLVIAKQIQESEETIAMLKK